MDNVKKTQHEKGLWRNRQINTLFNAFIVMVQAHTLPVVQHFQPSGTHVELIVATQGSQTLKKNAILTCYFHLFSCRHTPTHTPKRLHLLSPLSSGDTFIFLFNGSVSFLVMEPEMQLACLHLRSIKQFKTYLHLDKEFNLSVFFFAWDTGCIHMCLGHICLYKILF